jgi:hypothetical protein
VAGLDLERDATPTAYEMGESAWMEVEEKKKCRMLYKEEITVNSLREKRRMIR